jgi:hypothetical protein
MLIKKKEISNFSKKKGKKSKYFISHCVPGMSPNTLHPPSCIISTARRRYDGSYCTDGKVAT